MAAVSAVSAGASTGGLSAALGMSLGVVGMVCRSFMLSRVRVFTLYRRMVSMLVSLLWRGILLGIGWLTRRRTMGLAVVALAD